jgi:thioesterase domain-containing protein
MSAPISASVPANRPVVPTFTAAGIAELQSFLLHNIPLAAAMQLQVSGSDNTSELLLQAPLAANINDKGSAFGGATASLLTLAGWGWLWLANRHIGLQRDIVIAASEFSYQQPVYEQLRCICPGPAMADWQRYLQSMHKRDRARLSLACELRLADASLAATMTGHYATLPGAANR